jgi:hypothetical protein
VNRQHKEKLHWEFTATLLHYSCSPNGEYLAISFELSKHLRQAIFSNLKVCQCHSKQTYHLDMALCYHTDVLFLAMLKIKSNILSACKILSGFTFCSA